MNSSQQPLTFTDEITELRIKDEKLKAEINTCRKYLKTLKKQKEEVILKRKELEEVARSQQIFFQCKDVDLEVKDSEHFWEIVAQKTEQVRKVQEQIEQLKEETKEKLEMVEKMSVHYHFLEKVVGMSKFEDVQELINHLENLLYMRDKLSLTYNTDLEEVDTKRKELQSLEDKHRLTLVHKYNQLSQLQTKLEKYRSETRRWQQHWDKIQETAAKKTLMLGQIKVVTLNLYEMTGGAMGEEGVDINDTETQIDRISAFIQDHDGIVKLFYHRDKDVKEKSKQPKKFSNRKKK